MENETPKKQPKKKRGNPNGFKNLEGRQWKEGESGNLKGRPKSLGNLLGEELARLAGKKVPKAECDRILANIPYLSKSDLLEIVRKDMPSIVHIQAKNQLELYEGEHIPQDRKVLMDIQDRYKLEQDGGEEKTPISLAIFQQFHNAAVETKE